MSYPRALPLFLSNALLLLTGHLAFAAGGGKQNPTPLNAAEIKISSEAVPAGGTAQLQFSFTEPRPILSTGSSMALGEMSVDGVAVWSPNGTAAGLGVLKNGILSLNVTDPSGALSTNTDYPFLTVTVDVPSSLPAATVIPVSWASPWITGIATPLTLSVKPGAISIGGSLSIHGVYPGGGTYPAGTIVKITGSGFGTFTHLQTRLKFSKIAIAPTEIDLTLKDQTTLDAESFELSNPDGSRVTYFSYLRATYVRPPSRLFLRSVEPAFPQQTQAIANIGPIPALAPGQFVGLALQNPSLGPLVVTFELTSKGTNRIASVLLPPATRVVDDIAALLGGATLRQGDNIRVTSTYPVQMLGIHADENAGTAVPFLPSN